VTQRIQATQDAVEESPIFSMNSIRERSIMEQHRKQRKSYWLESVIGVCGLVLMFAGSQKGFRAADCYEVRAITSVERLYVRPVQCSPAWSSAGGSQAQGHSRRGRGRECKPSKPGGEGIKFTGTGSWMSRIRMERWSGTSTFIILL